jgi:hypothetical protein
VNSRFGGRSPSGALRLLSLSCIVDGTKPGGARTERTKHRQRRPRNGQSASNSHSNGGGGNTFLISFHRFRYDNHVRLRHPRSGPAHHDTPRRASIGGPSSSGSPVPFSHPARNAMSRTHNTHVTSINTHTQTHTHQRPTPPSQPAKHQANPSQGRPPSQMGVASTKRAFHPILTDFIYFILFWRSTTIESH